jgi:hypothetical protein
MALQSWRRLGENRKEKVPPLGRREKKIVKEFSK